MKSLVLFLKAKGMTVVGGGETAMAFNQMGLADGIKHISTGGGACISFMSGETMPALEAMRRSKKNDLTIMYGATGDSNSRPTDYESVAIPS